jgi:hypothetical protein
LHCAVLEGPDQQARLQRGLARAIELRKQTEAAALALAPESLLVPGGAMPAPSAAHLPAGPVALPLSVLPVSVLPVSEPTPFASTAPLPRPSTGLHSEPPDDLRSR